MQADDLGQPDSCQRRAFLEKVRHAALGGTMLSAISSVANPTAVLAARGEWAKIDMTGKAGVSGLGLLQHSLS